MDDITISLKNISKSYKMYNSPAEKLKEMFHPFKKKYHRDFWALRDVSFDVRKGETLGIIGRNGSGKSTLLKILCGVLQPNAGDVKVNGRISALLELGAGFNPEFTGRENVFMNGAIMGISAGEMSERFDSIASFADIGEFIDQPVKVYSSGMYVRLAFAIAINVDPDILIVDEALSVGDEIFQRKCFSRIHSIQKGGGTILFVSHGASAIVELCNSALLFDQGELLLAGPPKHVVSRYHKLIYAPAEKVEAIRNELRGFDKKEDILSADTAEFKSGGREHAPIQPEEPEQRPFYDPNLIPKSIIAYESRGAVIEKPRIITPEGERVNVLVRGEEYIYTYDIRFAKPAYSVRCGMMIKTVSGFELGGMVSHPEGDRIEYVNNGAVLKLRFKFRCALASGAYFMNAGVMGAVDGCDTYLYRVIDAIMFRVQPEKDLTITGIVDFSTVSSDSAFEFDSGKEMGEFV